MLLIHSIWIGAIFIQQKSIEGRLGKTFIAEKKYVTGYYRSSEYHYSGQKMDFDTYINLNEEETESYIKIPRTPPINTELTEGQYEVNYSIHFHKGWVTNINGLKIEIRNRSDDTILAQFVESEIKFNTSIIWLFVFPSFFEPFKSWFYNVEPESQTIAIDKNGTHVQVSRDNFEEVVFGFDE
ncbi:hypothetical protein J0X14_17930 [Muricauda sp. CAU 1633]|uniref:hypothetical protein n=1 Tax=Allomuricauda sp. CAU 1633 TaxID=2816036 RepID=UPI001A8C60B4|nr:hypothetical protein [Muricauda sp. CAU 1633]MBO0324194.1 hypothetical protein [Muricauda sp. CAU 1633]